MSARRMRQYRRVVPAHVMRRLREVATERGVAGWGAAWRRVNWSQEETARVLGWSRRTIQYWEADGALPGEAYAYVGLAYRIGGEERARETLAVLSEVREMEAVGIALARESGGA